MFFFHGMFENILLIIEFSAEFWPGNGRNLIIDINALSEKMEHVRLVNFGFSIEKCVRPPFWQK